MGGFDLLAIIIGALAALALPVFPFCLGLLVATAVGLIAGFLLLPSPLHVLMSGIVLFASGQAGYAIGLGISALRHHRRPSSARDFGPAPASVEKPAHTSR